MRQRRRLAAVWAAGLAAMVAVIALGSAGPTSLARLRALVFDGYQWLAPRETAGAPVVVVDIDEASLKALGQWPWPRSLLARLVERIGEAGAAAIAFDIVFPETDRASLKNAVAALRQAGARIELPQNADRLDNDALFAAAIARNPVVTGLVLTQESRAPPPPPKTGFALAGTDPQAYLPALSGAIANLPQLDAAATGIGFFSFPPAADGIVRRLPVVEHAAGQLYPALAVEALRVAQGAGSIVVRSTGASGEADTGAPAMTAIKVGALAVPTGPDGGLFLYYSGAGPEATLAAASILEAPAGDAALRQTLEGRIVLIGTSAVGLRDLVSTPLAAGVPGVFVHAEAIDQMLSGSFLARPDWAPGAEVSLALFLSLLVLLAVPFIAPAIGAVFAAFVAAAAVGVSWYAFIRHGLLIDPILPASSVAATHVAATAVLLVLTERERRFVKNAFSHYLAPSLVERLAEEPDRLTLGGETRELTILFCDIRGFTSLSEGLDPQALTSLLNDYLTPMTDVLLAEEATLDKYIGDAIMAFWNAPLNVAAHRRRATTAAIRMLRALEAFNQTHRQEIRVGIGLNTGPCCVGNLGSRTRFNYSAIGDAVNIAARLEGLCKQFSLPLILSEETAEGVCDLMLLKVDRVRVVGRAAPLQVFTLLDEKEMAEAAAYQRLRQAHEEMLTLYAQANVAPAKAALARLRDLAPARLGGFYDVYEERLEAFQRQPPPPGWDGVFVSEAK
ncbi:CHASE2 domain-containing protein [Afifella pfennigii]|uniref:CHASE2 domain-containing protein n=1 Tax=Afifella pfennigii TaxID=209897 RepID=UPI00047EA7CC|nr:adenylate/guanylate cyclase domain-containing protein [Afifella pfennigii]